MIPCICINDKNKPDEVPTDKWLEEGKKYHITFIYNMINQNGILGCTISEKSLDDMLPYNCYRLSRFGFEEKDIKALIQMMKDCGDFNDFNDNELLKITERELAMLN